MKPLWLILAIGVLTPFLSTALFFFWQPDEQVNNGEILPPTAVAGEDWHIAGGNAFSLDEWRGQWVLLIGGDGVCDAACQKRLCRIRQMRLLLPGHYLRLRRVWLVTDNTPPPDSLPQAGDCGEVSNVAIRERVRQEDVLLGVDKVFGGVDSLPAGGGRAATDYIYLIDPAGVWVMRFSPELTPAQIRQDMARLLKLSKGRRLIKVGGIPNKTTPLPQRVVRDRIIFYNAPTA